eukprot:gene2723-12596_t
MTKSLLTEVGPAAGDTGNQTGPIYKVAYATDEEPIVEKTLYETFEASVKRVPNRPCLGERKKGADGKAGPFTFLTYKEVHDIVSKVGSAYSQLGLKPKDRIGVIGSNSPEWRMAMQAMDRMSIVCVPLYETLGDGAIEYIVNHAEAKMVCAAGDKLPVLLKAMPKLKDTCTYGLVYWGAADAATLEGFKELGVTVTAWDDLLANGAANEVAAVSPCEDDLCTIMYTSGTTGDPKGVMITHKSIVTTIWGGNTFLKHQNKGGCDENDVFLSYLPLAHIFDRVVEELMMYFGSSIGYWQGDIKKLMDDIGALKPTLFAGVPRVFERIYNGVIDQVRAGGFVKNLIFNWAFNRKLGFMRRGWSHDKASVISDMLVFKKIKAKLGGRVRLIVTGGAPMSQPVEEFLRVAMCAPVTQGYGLTETCAASFLNFPFEMEQIGTVGPPLPHTEFRLREVADMNYSPMADPPRGEVCIRSAGCFQSYYKNEANTKESMDTDGFFHTGDIGEIMPSGALKIIDRKKNIFKLSQGEYIAVEKVENGYKACSLVEQIWVYGNSFESVLVGVVVPKEADLMKWAASEPSMAGKDFKEADLVKWAAAKSSMAGKDFKAVCASPEAKAHVLAELAKVAKPSGLKSLEMVKAIHLEPEMFSVEDDLLTPTFKFKRSPLQKKYQSEIDAMYAALKAKK